MCMTEEKHTFLKGMSSIYFLIGKASVIKRSFPFFRYLWFLMHALLVVSPWFFFAKKKLCRVLVKDEKREL